MKYIKWKDIEDTRKYKKRLRYKIKASKLIPIEEIDNRLKKLEVNNMMEFYSKYDVNTLYNTDELFIKYEKYVNKDELNIHDEQIKNSHLRSKDYTDNEFYDVLRMFYNAGEYDKFEILAKYLEFTDCEETTQLFEPYLILNRLN